VPKEDKEPSMRKCFLAALGIALLIGGTVTAPIPLVSAAEAAGPINPQVAALLRQYPDGGPGLRAAIARLVEGDASLAEAVVAAAETANPAQQTAMGAGLGDAQDFFAKIGSDFALHAAALIRAAVIDAGPILLAGYLSAVTPNDANVIPGTNNSVGNTTSACISPSKPGGRC
jgi:hypothetical protein